MLNHGVFTIGNSAKQATKMAIEVEDIAKITHLAMVRGQPIMLTDEQIAEVAELYAHNYGQNRKWLFAISALLCTPKVIRKSKPNGMLAEKFPDGIT